MTNPYQTTYSPSNAWSTVVIPHPLALSGLAIENYRAYHTLYETRVPGAPTAYAATSSLAWAKRDRANARRAGLHCEVIEIPPNLENFTFFGPPKVVVQHDDPLE